MRIIDEKTKREIINPDLTVGELWDALGWVSPERYAQAEAEGLEAVPDEWREDVQLYHVWTPEEIAQREEAEREAAKREAQEKLLLTLSEAFSETYEPSDKIGFLWKVVKLGEVEIMREYVTDPEYDPTGEDGTYLKPYRYIEGMEVIETKWYWLDDKLLPHECIKSGIPTSFDDAEFFDIVA